MSLKRIKSGAIKLRENGTLRPSWMGAHRVTLGDTNVWEQDGTSPVVHLDLNTPGGHDIQKLEAILEKVQTYGDIMAVCPVIYDGSSTIMGIAGEIGGSWVANYGFQAFPAYYLGDYSECAYPDELMPNGYSWASYFFVPAVNGVLEITWQRNMDGTAKVTEITLNMTKI